jgi:hypothetical protein
MTSGQFLLSTLRLQLSFKYTAKGHKVTFYGTRMNTDFHGFLSIVISKPGESGSYSETFNVLYCDQAKYNNRCYGSTRAHHGFAARGNGTPFRAIR